MDLLSANVKDRYEVYRNQSDLGNEQEARKERKEAVIIAGKIVEKLEFIRDNAKKTSTRSKIQNHALTPMTGQKKEEEGLEEKDWVILLDSIKAKKCIPFLGAELFSPYLSLEGKIFEQWTKSLSEQWSRQYGYPFEDSSQLPRVTEFIAIDQDDLMYPKRELSKLVQKINPPDFTTEEFNDSPYSIIADLDLPIYVTTNYDHLLEKALENRNRKKSPVSEICRWNDKVKMYLKRAGRESIFSRGSKYKPTPDIPLVYHLLGDMETHQSMVLTERDYIDFIINLNVEGAILPSAILNELATSSLLFIGYNLEDINFRIIFQCILGLQVGDMRDISISVQLRPRLTSDKEQKALNYLREYTKGKNVHVYWGNSVDFCKDLRQRLSLLK